MAESNKTEELFNVDLNAFEEMAQFIEEKEKFIETDETDESINAAEMDEVQTADEDIEVTEDVDDENQNKPDTQEDKKDPSSHDTKSDSSHLTPYFKLLVEEGLFDSSEESEWDGTAEGFVNLEQKKFNSWKEKYKAETLHPRVKWLQDNLEEGVPFEKLLKLDKEITDFESVTEDKLSDVDIQRNLAREYYKETTRFSDERITREIKRLEDSNELEEEVKSSFYPELKGIKEEKKTKELQQVRLERETAEKEQKKVLDNFKATLSKTEEIIPGRKITEIMRDKIFSTLTTVVDVDEQTGMPLNSIAKARNENPLEFELKLAYLFEVTKGFSDWSQLTVSGRKQAYDNFEKAARDIDKKDSSSKQNIRQSSNSADFLGELDKLHKKGLI